LEKKKKLVESPDRNNEKYIRKVTEDESTSLNSFVQEEFEPPDTRISVFALPNYYADPMPAINTEGNVSFMGNNFIAKIIRYMNLSGSTSLYISLSFIF